MGSVSSEDGFDQQSERCGSYSLSVDVSESESCSSFSCRRCDAEGASSSMTSSPRPGIGNFCFPVPLSVMLPVIGGRDVMVWDEKQEADFSGKKMSTSQARPKPKPKQGKSFSVEEDEALCIAWLTISQDPVTGSGQPLAKFWDRVLLHFVSKNVCQEPRTSCSIQCRWAQIRHLCTKYRGCLAQIQHRPAKSGSNLLDKVVQAKKLFENDLGKPFHLDHCWEILKCCDKWIIVEAPTLPHSSPMKNKRPPGPKTEKESRRKSNASPANSSSAFIDTMRDVLAQKEMRRVLFEEEKLGLMKAASDREVLQLQLARAAEERMRATEERMRATEERKKAANDREQRREDEAIMKIDITGMSPDLQYYYQLQKNAIMAKALQKAGFYICWGCLVWVPSVYTSPGMYLVNHPVNLGTQLALYILVAGILCIYINYDCDRQRQEFRRTNGKCLVWGKAPSKIEASYTTTSGETKSSLLLTSGWWGLSRHFHYVPEILAAFFWTVPALFNHFLPYFYVIFLTILLLDRAKRDDDRCRSKYGKYWKLYCKKVPYRIIPGIY